MGCTIEFNEPPIKFDFYRNKFKQKIWIDAILRYGAIDIAGLATLLDLHVKALQNVHSGNLFLAENEAQRLAQLFLIIFSD